MPLLFEDEHGIVMGNEWAVGFVQGMHMRLDAWEPLVAHKQATLLALTFTCMIVRVLGPKPGTVVGAPPMSVLSGSPV